MAAATWCKVAYDDIRGRGRFIRRCANPMRLRSIEEFFQQGIDLFNEGRFFESHEAWEQAWLRSGGMEKLFYQGLIQAAAAILHAQRGNLEGAKSLWAKAIDKLGPLPDGYGGIALDELRRALAKFFDPLPGADRTDKLPTIKRLA